MMIQSANTYVLCLPGLIETNKQTKKKAMCSPGQGCTKHLVVSVILKHMHFACSDPLFYILKLVSCVYE